MPPHGACCPGIQVRVQVSRGEDCGSALVDCSLPGPDLHPQGGMMAQGLITEQDDPPDHLYPGIRCHSQKGHPMLMLV